MTTTFSPSLPALDASSVHTALQDTVRQDSRLAHLVAGGTVHLSPLARWCSFATRGVRRVERAMQLRRRAIDAEAQGHAVTADFFWTETHREFEQLARHPDWWRGYIETIDVANDTRANQDAADLFRACVRYALIDTHLACCDAWRSRDQGRAYLHLDYVRRLRALAGFSACEDREYTGPLTLEEIRFRQNAGQWATALSLVSDLVRRFPDVSEYQNCLAIVRGQATLAALTGADTRRGRRADARTLASGVFALKKLRLERPHNLATFDAIARLHLARAETLAADGLLAEALVDAESALTYAPGIAGGADLRTRLEAEMQRWRVESAAAADAPRTRNRDVRRRQQQTAKGFRLVEAFRRSDEARAVTEDLPVAQGRLVWESIGLTPLEAVDHRPLALNDAIQTIVNAPPSHRNELVERWRHVSQDNPHLHALDENRVCAYLRHVLYAEPFVPAPADVAPISVRPVALAVNAPVRSRDPFMFWAFSRRNRLVKVQVFVAAVLAVMAMSMATREFQGRRDRDSAYASLHQARDEARYLSMLDAAEQFLSSRIIGADDRVAEVEGVYSEALVRWFNETAPPPEEAERRIARYRQLMSIGSGDTR
jgi:hypothetical protein